MKTLFIDFDGTICHDRFWRSVSPSEYQLIQSVLFGTDTTFVKDWMCGRQTSEDINQLVAQKTQLSYDYLWQHFVHDCETMTIDRNIFEIISELRQYYTLVLITGNMDCFSRWTVPSLQLATYFNIIVNSATEGQLKTENGGETFLKYLSGNITDALLIEDSPTSCAIFTALGGTALPVTSEHPALEHLQTIARTAAKIPS